jgi:type IV pilus assembly protein PilB
VSDGTQLGTLLCQQGLITQAQLDAALAEQATSGKPLGRVLIDRGHVAETDLVRTLAKQVGLEFVDLSERTVDPSVAGLIPENLARKYQALPIEWDESGRLVVAMGDPSNVFAVDDIRALTGADIFTVVATAGQLA